MLIQIDFLWGIRWQKAPSIGVIWQANELLM